MRPRRLEDLAAAGVASHSSDGWQLSGDRLNAIALRMRTNGETYNSALNVSPEPDLNVLRRKVFNRLRRKRTTEVEGDGGIKALLFAVHQMSVERRRLNDFQLPTQANQATFPD